MLLYQVGLKPLLQLGDVNLPLPSTEAVWERPTAEALAKEALKRMLLPSHILITLWPTINRCAKMVLNNNLQLHFSSRSTCYT
jgi:hypothetical protein